MVVATQVQILSAATFNISKYLPVMAFWNPQRFPTWISVLWPSIPSAIHKHCQITTKHNAILQCVVWRLLPPIISQWNENHITCPHLVLIFQYKKTGSLRSAVINFLVDEEIPKLDIQTRLKHTYYNAGMGASIVRRWVQHFNGRKKSIVNTTTVFRNYVW